MGLEHIILLILIIIVGILFFKLTFKILRYLAINTIVGLIVGKILNFLGIYTYTLEFNKLIDNSSRRDYRSIYLNFAFNFIT